MHLLYCIKYLRREKKLRIKHWSRTNSCSFRSSVWHTFNQKYFMKLWCQRSSRPSAPWLMLQNCALIVLLLMPICPWFTDVLNKKNCSTNFCSNTYNLQFKTEQVLIKIWVLHIWKILCQNSIKVFLVGRGYSFTVYRLCS